ncbi:MAG: hypothetical protein L0241_24390 [Planctomycetia bacterium]|nr:hypothetical protein [Planctomycetia bacterium]
MSEPESFSLAGLDVTVEESPNSLTYTFNPHNPVPRLRVPPFLVLFMVVLPLGVLGVVTSALIISDANRPAWELVLTGLFIAQLVAWLSSGGAAILRMLFRSWRAHRTTLIFTRAHLSHGGNRVCELAHVRGLRLFICLETDEQPGKSRAGLSLVIGDERATRGLFGGFEPQALRTLAEDIQRRLTAFRFNQGLMSPLESLSEVETTEGDAANLMDTFPTRGTLPGFTSGAARLILDNPWAGIAWCLVIFAGLFASGRLMLGVGLSPALLTGHLFLGFIHLAMLSASFGEFKRGPADEKKG